MALVFPLVVLVFKRVERLQSVSSPWEETVAIHTLGGRRFVNLLRIHPFWYRHPSLINVFSKAVMDILREFLESSTIHGLSYISTSKVKDLYMPISVGFRHNLYTH